MGIRVEHQPSAGALGMAAFAAGRGKGRERRRKYAMDLYRDERRLQARRQDQLEGFKYREALEGTRQLGLLGRERLRQEGMEERSEALHKRTLEGEQRREGRRAREARSANLTRIPEWADKDLQNKLSRQATGIREMLLSGQHDLDDPSVQDKLRDEIESYENTVGSLQAPSGAEELKNDLVYVNEETDEVFDERAPGRRAYRRSTGEPLIDRSKEEAEAKKAKAEAEKRQQKLRDDLKKAEEDFAKTDPEKGDLRKLYKGRVDKLKAEIDAGGAPEQSAPLPAGMPAGSQRVDEDTVRLPSGRIAKRTGAPAAASGPDLSLASYETGKADMQRRMAANRSPVEQRVSRYHDAMTRWSAANSLTGSTASVPPELTAERDAAHAAMSPAEQAFAQSTSAEGLYTEEGRQAIQKLELQEQEAKAAEQLEQVAEVAREARWPSQEELVKEKEMAGKRRARSENKATKAQRTRWARDKKKGWPVQDRAIAAARAGDVSAQRTLDGRGVSWKEQQPKAASRKARLDKSQIAMAKGGPDPRMPGEFPAGPKSKIAKAKYSSSGPEPAVPGEFPAGTKRISKDTIELPDGRRLRKSAIGWLPVDLLSGGS